MIWLLIPLVLAALPGTIVPNFISVEKPEVIAFIHCAHLQHFRRLLRYAVIGEAELELVTKGCTTKSFRLYCCHYGLLLTLNAPSGDFEVKLLYEDRTPAALEEPFKLLIAGKPLFKNPEFITEPNEMHIATNFAGRSILWDPKTGPQKQDVVQGDIANCFLIQVLGTLSESTPWIIMNKVKIVDGEKGIYSVILHDPSEHYEAIEYLVNTDLTTSVSAPRPRHVETRRLLTGEHVIWPLLYEKAFASLLSDLKRKNHPALSALVLNPDSCERTGYHLMKNGGFAYAAMSVITGLEYDMRFLSGLKQHELEKLNGSPHILVLGNVMPGSRAASERYELILKEKPCLSKNHVVPLISYQDQLVTYWCDLKQDSYTIPVRLLTSTIETRINIRGGLDSLSFLSNPNVRPIEMAYGYWDSAPPYVQPQFSYENLPWIDGNLKIQKPLTYALRHHADKIGFLVDKGTFIQERPLNVYLVHLRSVLDSTIVSTVTVSDAVVQHEGLIHTPFVIPDKRMMIPHMGTWILRVAIGKFFEYFLTYERVYATTFRHHAVMIFKMLAQNNLCVYEFDFKGPSKEAALEHLSTFKTGFFILRDLNDCTKVPVTAYDPENPDKLVVHCENGRAKKINLTPTYIETLLDLQTCAK